MVFDLTRPETLTDLDRWHLDFTQKAGDVPLMLFGNKCDLVNERLVQSEAGEISAEKYNATYLETSALDGTNVQEAFTELAEQIIAHIEKRRSSISRTY
jgi:GTPase SAR1 family protein